MEAPRLQPDDDDRVPMTAGRIALARQRAERTVIPDDRGDAACAVVPVADIARLHADDEARRAAVERIHRIAENFPGDEPEDAAMAAALALRSALRADTEALSRSLLA